MTIKYYTDLEQGSEAWIAVRCGLLTASEMKLIITPKELKYASNEKEREHLFELAAQRVTQYVEPKYMSDDMLRGTGDEFHAKVIYNDKIAGVRDCGFVTNDKWGFTLGCSPDALVADFGGVECKSRRQKFQFKTILANEMPEEFKLQVQTSMLITERPWWDFNSYCGGMPMLTLKIEPDEKVQKAIIEVATMFHEKLELVLKQYADRLADPAMRLIPTERIVEQEMVI